MAMRRYSPKGSPKGPPIKRDCEHSYDTWFVCAPQHLRQVHMNAQCRVSGERGNNWVCLFPDCGKVHSRGGETDHAKAHYHESDD